MNHKYHRLLCLLLLGISFHSMNAQFSNTLYFMDEIAERNQINPAFTPSCKSYFDFIFLPNLYFTTGSNTLTIKDFLYNVNGKTQTIFSSDVSKNFYKNLISTTQINANIDLGILNFGWQTQLRNFYSIGINLKSSVNMYIPRDLFKFALEGTENENGINHFNFNHFGIDATLYNEMSFGYSRILNDKWTVGGRAKLLMGYANLTTKVDNFSLDASRENWTLQAYANIKGSLPFTISKNEDGKYDPNKIDPLSTKQYLDLLYNPSGWGAAIDLGATYKPVKELTVSAALTDLGFMHWHQYLYNGTLNGTYIFDGAFEGDLSSEDSKEDSDEESKKVFDKLKDKVVESTDFKEGNPYSQMLMANALIGVEYGILNNKISFGALSRTQFNASHIFEEVTLSTNFRPANWFKTTLSYTLFNGGWGTLGLGLNLRLGAMNMYLVTDFIPLSWATLKQKNSVSSIPYSASRINAQMGIAFNIGTFSRDSDQDGVKNKKDLCIDTDLTWLKAQCPDKKKKELINKHGCIFDNDSDGVQDCYDRCPNTPKGVLVDSLGCPLDRDLDGVPDSFDKCPSTPPNVEVNSEGCPLDSDGDGIPDYLDQCPNTTSEAYGQVNFNGCPKDDDQDGIPNYLDLCPNTPEGVQVNQNGCPPDSDNDGIPDYLDKCPNTPIGAIGYTDSDGCPTDTDQDGVPNYLDQCPNTPKNTLVDRNGCPIEVIKGTPGNNHKKTR